jgi:hypothetical protein
VEKVLIRKCAGFTHFSVELLLQVDSGLVVLQVPHRYDVAIERALNAEIQRITIWIDSLKFVDQ